MKKWLETLARLRAARQAREDFLIRDFVDRAIIGPMLLDRLVADLHCHESFGKARVSSVQSVRPIADDRYLE